MEMEGLTRLSAPIVEATFFEIACVFSFQGSSSMYSPRALLWFVWFILTGAVYSNIYSLSFKDCNFWRESANDLKVSFSDIEA